MPQDFGICPKQNRNHEWKDFKVVTPLFGKITFACRYCGKKIQEMSK